MSEPIDSGAPPEGGGEPAAAPDYRRLAAEWHAGDGAAPHLLAVPHLTPAQYRLAESLHPGIADRSADALASVSASAEAQARLAEVEAEEQYHHRLANEPDFERAEMARAELDNFLNTKLPTATAQELILAEAQYSDDLTAVLDEGTQAQLRDLHDQLEPVESMAAGPGTFPVLVPDPDNPLKSIQLGFLRWRGGQEPPRFKRV